MSDKMTILNNKIKSLVKDRGLKGYSMTLAPRTKGTLADDYADALSLAMDSIDSPHNISPFDQN